MTLSKGDLLLWCFLLCSARKLRTLGRYEVTEEKANRFIFRKNQSQKFESEKQVFQ